MLETLLGDNLSKPIDAIGNVIGKIYTTDEERLKAQEVLEKIRQHPQELQEEFDKLKLQSDTEDKISARQREMSLHDKLPSYLALFVTFGFFAVTFWMLFDNSLSSTVSDVMHIMVGILGTAWIGIINYYFGGSAIPFNIKK